MSNFKEFQAKTLDQAIQDACAFYNTQRVKLEIDILEDAKSGIFGLVGARKARINARMAQIPTSFPSPEEKKATKPSKNTKPKNTHKNTAKANVESLENKLDSMTEEKFIANEQIEPTEKSRTNSRNKTTHMTIPSEDEPKPTSKPSNHHAKSQHQTPQTTQSNEHTEQENKEKTQTRYVKPHHAKSQKTFDEEDDGSQRKFLSKINTIKMPPLNPYEEELEDHVLEALDREAMAKANLLGNMTEAEIRAQEQNTNLDDNGYKSHTRNNNSRNNGRFARDNRDNRSRNGRDSRDFHDNKRSHDYTRTRDNFETRDTRDNRYTRDNRDNRDNRNNRDNRAPREYKNNRDFRENKESNITSERAFYEEKRRQERALRPPKQIIQNDYEPVSLPRVPLEELDTELLISTAHEVIFQLVIGIVGEDAPIEIKIDDDRVHVSIESEDTGLLIGREGQHLAAIQYLLARIMTRRMGSQIRVQVDTGDYHSRQDSRMEFLAHSLAEKAKSIGRPQSTRPLSAYQRRVIHLALQDDEEIQTRSCGEGTLKRVIVMRRRHTYQESNTNHENTNMDMESTEAENIPLDMEHMPEYINDNAFYDENMDIDIVETNYIVPQENTDQVQDSLSKDDDSNTIK